MRLRCFLSRHGLPLLVVSVAQLAAQLGTLLQPQVVAVNADTTTYVHVAHMLTWNPTSWIDDFRTPGYPLFLRLIYLGRQVPPSPYRACPTLSSIVHPVCATGFGPVVIAQVALVVATTFGVYTLAYRLLHQPWIAASAAILTGCNFYLLSWERNVSSETLSAALLIASFLVLERYVRRPSFPAAALLALLWTAAIMVRPFNVALPGVIIVLLVARAIWIDRTQLRKVLPSSLLVLLVVYSCVGAYSLANGRMHGTTRLTLVSDVNLYGKVLEYHLASSPAPARYAAIRTASITYLAQTHGGRISPWIAIAEQHGGMRTGVYGAYARSVILQHPFAFLTQSIPDLARAWLPTTYPVMPRYAGAPTSSPLVGITALYSQYRQVAPSAPFDLWLSASTVDEFLFALLPLITAGLLLWLRRDPKNTTAFVLLCLAALVLVTIAVAAFGDYSAFPRIRAPSEWAMYLLVTSSIYLAVRALLSAKEPRASLNICAIL
jgi:hypothetical protein